MMWQMILTTENFLKGHAEKKKNTPNHMFSVLGINLNTGTSDAVASTDASDCIIHSNI